MGQAVCKCLAPPPVGGSRAARMFAHGNRARYLFKWMDEHAIQAAKLAKLRQAATALANVPLKRAHNQWHTCWQQEKAAKELLLAAVRGIVNSKARKVYNAWTEMVQEKHEFIRKLRAAAAAMSPEGRAKKAVLRKLMWIKRRKAAMIKAANGFILAGCRSALHKMHAQLEQMRKLRKGGNAIRLRKARQCWNQWAETTATAKARMEKLAIAAKAMTPEGRMLRYGWGKLREGLDAKQQMRAALSGFINGSLKRAMTAWIESTFMGFHLSSGEKDFARWLMRRAVRLWVGRSKVRRGLRKHVWTCAHKGESELSKLLDMIEQSDTDDVVNAIMARDAGGSTPLLIAAKKGFADVAETLIGTVHNIVSDGVGGLSQEDLASMVNTADSDGNSALHWAARKGHEAVAVHLIESGAVVDFANKEESTPLHWAARKHNGALIELLLHAGASALLQNKWGASALDNAKQVRGESRANSLLEAAVKEQSRKAFLFSKQQQQQQQQGDAASDDSTALAADAAAASAAAAVAASTAAASSATEAYGKAWGVGPGVSDKAPRGIKQKAAQRRVAANQRREAALKARDAQEEAKANDLKLRRQRGAIELKLRELGDALAGPLEDPRPGGGSPVRAKSPPKLAATQALRAVLDEAKALGGCNAQVVGEAEARLVHAHELRAKAKREAEIKAEKERRSPSKKKGKPGEKSEEEKLAIMEKKLLRQMARR